MFKVFVSLGSLFAALGVVMGAFGAHGLKSQLTPDMLKVFNTAVEYHLFHAAGLILIGILSRLTSPSSLLMGAGAAMLCGIILFSGSLYLLSTTGVRWLGAITPLGGLAFIVAWVLLTVHIWRYS